MSGQTEIMWGTAVKAEISEVDNNPKEWPAVKFDSVVLINPSEKLPKGTQAKKVAMDKIHPFTKRVKGYDIEAYSGGTKFKNGDTLLARITPCLENGKTSFVDFLDENEVAFGSTEYIVIRERPGVTDKHFLYYLAISPDFRDAAILGMTGSSGRQRVETDVIRNHEILLPPLSEQRAIAAALSRIDEKIDLLHRQNSTLEALAETLFRQRFAEEAKEEWELGQVKDLVDVLSGFPFKSSTFVESGQYSLITIKAVQNGYLELSNADKLNEIPAKMPKYCRLSMGDILLSLTGNVGRCCLVDGVDLLLNQRVAKMKPKNERDWAFTYVLFRQSSMRTTLEELAKGTAQANLSPIETANMEFSIPDAATLEAFSKAATPWIKKLLLNKKGISVLSTLRNTLLPRLMSGEVRVVY